MFNSPQGSLESNILIYKSGDFCSTVLDVAFLNGLNDLKNVTPQDNHLSKLGNLHTLVSRV